MYAVTRKATDAQANAAIRRCCLPEGGGGCLKTRLWRPIGPGKDERDGSAAAFPLFCNEACNLLVAAIRAEVKPEGKGMKGQ